MQRVDSIAVDSLHLSFITNFVILMMIIISCKNKKVDWVTELEHKVPSFSITAHLREDVKRVVG